MVCEDGWGYFERRLSSSQMFSVRGVIVKGL
jgi:hypothetical protein